MKIELFADVELRDKNGKVIRRIHKKCNSYVRQLIDLLYMHMAQNSANMKQTSGSTTSCSTNTLNFRVGAAASDNTYGIQVGTNATSGGDAVAIDNYHLNTLIANGNTATQLSYGAVSVGAVAIVGTSAKFTIARTLTNNSGADITVNEVGLVESGSGSPALIERTLLTFTVANGTSGTVTYTISVTV